MPSEILWRIIGWFSLPVLAVLVGVLIWRRIPRQFPYFFYYVLAGELIGLLRLWFYNPAGRVYFYFYWLTDVLIALFAFFATYELFVHRLFPRFYAIRFYRYLFPLAAMIITALVVPAILQARKLSYLLTVIHGFEVLRVAILIFFVGLMLAMGRKWSRYEFGIALGLGVQASALLMTSAAWVRSPFLHSVVDRLPVIVYDLACLIWMITFLKQEASEPLSSVPAPQELLEEARKWEESLKETLGGKEPHS